MKPKFDIGDLVKTQSCGDILIGSVSMIKLNHKKEFKYLIGGLGTIEFDEAALSRAHDSYGEIVPL